MIFRNARLILGTDLTILMCSVVTSLLGARALGPAGRGDLLIITLWPLVTSLLAEMGLPNAYRYWVAKDPARVPSLISNAILYTIAVSIVSITLAYFAVPHLVSQPSIGMTLVRITHRPAHVTTISSDDRVGHPWPRTKETECVCAGNGSGDRP